MSDAPTRDEHLAAAEEWLAKAEDLWDNAQRDLVMPTEAGVAAAIATVHAALATLATPAAPAVPACTCELIEVTTGAELGRGEFTFVRGRSDGCLVHDNGRGWRLGGRSLVDGGQP